MDIQHMYSLYSLDRLRVGWLNLSGRGAARAEDAQGTPIQSHISPSILVYEDNEEGERVWYHNVIIGDDFDALEQPEDVLDAHDPDSCFRCLGLNTAVF